LFRYIFTFRCCRRLLRPAICWSQNQQSRSSLPSSPKKLPKPNMNVSFYFFLQKNGKTSMRTFFAFHCFYLGGTIRTYTLHTVPYKKYIKNKIQLFCFSIITCRVCFKIVAGQPHPPHEITEKANAIPSSCFACCNARGEFRFSKN